MASADFADGDPQPAALRALTVKVYGLPRLSPLMEHAVLIEMQVAPPGDATTR